MKSVFISSTFRDMHRERDLLNMEVLPYLNSVLGRRGASVQFSDLRWGIDTTDMSEEEANLRILAVCDDEISRCRPFIIVLLGERYGSVLQDASATRSENEAERPGLPQGISVTHREIIRGVFENADRDSVFIYMREADYDSVPETERGKYVETDPAGREKLINLKSQLQDEYGSCIRVYHSFWDEKRGMLDSREFAQMVRDDLEKALLREFAAQPSHPVMRQRLENESILQDAAESLYLPADRFQEGIRRIREAKSTVLLCGKGGSGKTACLSAAVKDLRAEGVRAEIYYCGINDFTYEPDHLVLYVLMLIEEICQNRPKGPDTDRKMPSWQEMTDRLLEASEVFRGKLYLMIDSPQNCLDHERIAPFLRFMEFVYDGRFTVVLACTDAYADEAFGIGSRRMRLDWTPAEAEEIFSSITRRYRRALSPTVCRLAAEKTTNPLQLYLLVQRLLHLNASDFDAIAGRGGGIDAINGYLEELIQKKGLEIRPLIEELESCLYDDSSDREFADCMLKILALSRRGIREKDLPGIFAEAGWKWSNLHYASFAAGFSFLLRFGSDGLVRIANVSVSDSILAGNEEITGGETVSRAQILRLAMARYYRDQDACDLWNAANYLDLAAQAGQFQGFAEYLTVRIRSEVDFDEGMRAENFRRSRILALLHDGREDFLLKAAENYKDSLRLLFLMLLVSAVTNDQDDPGREEIEGRVKFLEKVVFQDKDGIPAMALWFKTKLTGFLRRKGLNDLVSQVDQYFDERISELESCDSGRDIPREIPEDVKADLKVPDGDQENRAEAGADISGISMDLLNRVELLEHARQLVLVSRHIEAEKQIWDIIKWFQETYFADSDGEEDYSSLSLFEKMILGDCYSQLGGIYKAIGLWNASLEADERSLEIYSLIREEKPSPEIERKYRTRLFNIANVWEAKALKESRPELWEKTRDCFLQCVREDLRFLPSMLKATEISEVVSSQFSCLHAMLHTDDWKEALPYLGRFFRLAAEHAALVRKDRVYAMTAVYGTRILIRLLDLGLYEDADRTAEMGRDWILETMERDRSLDEKAISFIYRQFNDPMVSLLEEVMQTGNLETASRCCQIGILILKAVFGRIDPQYGMQLVILSKNGGDIHYRGTGDLARAAGFYRQLLTDMQQDPYSKILDLDPRASMQIADFLCMSFARGVNAVMKSQGQEEAEGFILANRDFVLSLSRFVPQLTSHPERILQAAASKIEDGHLRALVLGEK